MYLNWFDSVQHEQVYVLGDTTYNSLGVDEVAAQHVNAQCVVSLVVILQSFA